MRLELILEPKAAAPLLPDYLKKPLVVNRRILSDISPANVSTAITWARGLKENRIIEEFYLGPATLEDVYVQLVKNHENNGNHGKDA
jgi:hypothetical protein